MKAAVPEAVRQNLTDVGATDMSGKVRFASDARGWLFAVGLGVLTGCLVGSGAMDSYTHAQWPALAGIVLGMAIPLAAPARPVRLAFCGASVAVVAAVAMIVSGQLQSGRWPIADEVAVALYGTATQAAMRAAVILGVLLGAPCLIGAALVDVVRRRYTREDAAPTWRNG